MAILKNKAFVGKDLITAYGKITFSAEGKAEVEDNLATKLATLNGFSIEADEEINDEEDTVEEEDTTEEEDNEEDEQIDESVDEEEADEENPITREELENMTVKQLEKYAKEMDIDLAGATKKAEIISVILGE